MIRKLVALALCFPLAAHAVDLVGAWRAETGYPGSITFGKNGTVTLQPAGVPGLSGRYAITGAWLEITPNDGRPAATMHVTCASKDVCEFAYTNGDKQTFRRIR